MRCICRGIHYQFAGSNGSSAAFCPELIEARGSGAYAAVDGDIGAAHRSGKHAVAKDNTAKCDGTAQMRIFSNHKIPPNIVSILYSISREKECKITIFDIKIKKQ